MKLGIRCKTCGYLPGPKTYTAVEVFDRILGARKRGCIEGVEDAIAAMREGFKTRHYMDGWADAAEKDIREKTGVKP